MLIPVGRRSWSGMRTGVVAVGRSTSSTALLESERNSRWDRSVLEEDPPSSSRTSTGCICSNRIDRGADERLQAKRILGSRADTLARECSIGHAFLNMITPGRETTPSGVPQPPRTVRERVLAELRARGASRQKTLVENLRTVGARGLLETAVASARGLLVPFPEGPKPESRHSGEPIVLDVKTAHPVMEREAYSSFSWLDMEGYEAEIDRRR